MFLPCQNRSTLKGEFAPLEILDIPIFPFLDGNIPWSASYGTNSSQLICFIGVSSHHSDFSNSNKVLIDKLLKQGYLYHTVHKTVSLCQYSDLIVKDNVSLKTLLQLHLSKFIVIWFINSGKWLGYFILLNNLKSSPVITESQETLLILYNRLHCLVLTPSQLILRHDSGAYGTQWLEFIQTSEWQIPILCQQIFCFTGFFSTKKRLLVWTLICPSDHLAWQLEHSFIPWLPVGTWWLHMKSDFDQSSGNR